MTSGQVGPKWESYLSALFALPLAVFGAIYTSQFMRPGLRRLINALGYSLDGLAAAFRHEAAFRQLSLLAAVLLPLGLPGSDQFWSGPPAPWTSVLAWSGKEFPIDHAE